VSSYVTQLPVTKGGSCQSEGFRHWCLNEVRIDVGSVERLQKVSIVLTQSIFLSELCGNLVGALRGSLREIEVSDFGNWVVGCDAAPCVLVWVCVWSV
jgi:hypothetical protein